MELSGRGGRLKDDWLNGIETRDTEEGKVTGVDEVDWVRAVKSLLFLMKCNCVIDTTIISQAQACLHVKKCGFRGKVGLA